MLCGDVEAGKIKLRCPKCGRVEIVDRIDSDPASAAWMVTECDRSKCDEPGTWESPIYYRADGSEIRPSDSDYENEPPHNA